MNSPMLGVSLVFQPIPKSEREALAKTSRARVRARDGYREVVFQKTRSGTEPNEGMSRLVHPLFGA